VVLDARRFEKILVVGAGKATARMCQALEEILGDRISDGVIVVKRGYVADLRRVRIVEAAHPIPDEAGVQGVTEMLRILDALDERALVFALISGGGSALLPAPAGEIRIADKQKLTEMLLRASARHRRSQHRAQALSGIKRRRFSQEGLSGNRGESDPL